MKKLIKRLVKILIGLGIVAGIAIIAIINLVNPTQFKDIVEKKVYEQTGHVLDIQGPIAWRLFPRLALELENVTLENAPPFTDSLASAKSIRAVVEFLPLIVEGKFSFGLRFKGLKVALVRNKNGIANWEILQTNIKNANPKNEPMAADTSIEKSAFQNRAPYTMLASDTVSVKTKSTNDNSKANNSNTKSDTATRIVLHGIRIDNGEITFDDETKNHHYYIDNLNLKSQNFLQGIVGSSNPIVFNFHFQNLTEKTEGNLDLTAKWAVQHAIKNTATSPEVDTSRQLSLNNVNLKLDFPNLHAQSKGNKKESYSGLQTTVEGNFTIDLSKDFLKNPHIEGQFSSKKLNVNKFVLEDIKGTLLSQDGTIQLKPISFNFVKSRQEAILKIDLNGAIPKYALSQTGQAFEISHVFALMDQKNKLEGSTQLRMDFSSSGKSLYDIQNNLSGRGVIEISNGKFYGIDLIKILQSAQIKMHDIALPLLKGGSDGRFNLKNLVGQANQDWEAAAKPIGPEKSTPFHSAKATITLANNMLHNPNLTITHPDYDIQAAGNLHLVNETIQYHGSVLLKSSPFTTEDAITKYLQSVPLPINATGTFSNPIIRPDFKTYANNAMAYMQQTVLKNTVEKAVGKVVEKTLDTIIKNPLERLLGQ